MYKGESCKICGQSLKLYDCEKCYGLCQTNEQNEQPQKVKKAFIKKKTSNQ